MLLGSCASIEITPRRHRLGFHITVGKGSEGLQLVNRDAPQQQLEKARVSDKKDTEDRALREEVMLAQAVTTIEQLNTRLPRSDARIDNLLASKVFDARAVSFEDQTKKEKAFLAATMTAGALASSSGVAAFGLAVQHMLDKSHDDRGPDYLPTYLVLASLAIAFGITTFILLKKYKKLRLNESKIWVAALVMGIVGIGLAVLSGLAMAIFALISAFAAIFS